MIYQKDFLQNLININISQLYHMYLYGLISLDAWLLVRDIIIAQHLFFNQDQTTHHEEEFYRILKHD